MGRTVLHMGSSTVWSRAIIARVNEAIEASGHSVREVAKLSGISRETLRRRLGENPTPFTVNEIESIADVLHVDPSDLLGPRRMTEAS